MPSIIINWYYKSQVFSNHRCHPHGASVSVFLSFAKVHYGRSTHQDFDVWHQTAATKFGCRLWCIEIKYVRLWKSDKMSEGKSALFAKTVQKHAGRAKEKVFITYPFTLQCLLCGDWFTRGFATLLTWKCRVEELAGSRGRVAGVSRSGTEIGASDVTCWSYTCILRCMFTVFVRIKLVVK